MFHTVHQWLGDNLAPTQNPFGFGMDWVGWDVDGLTLIPPPASMLLAWS